MASGRPVYADWNVTREHSKYQPRQRAQSNKDGLAVAQRVGEKRDRYPPQGGELAPLAVECGGHPSEELVAFVRSYGCGVSPSERSEVISQAWRSISTILQVGNAEMILSAVG